MALPIPSWGRVMLDRLVRFTEGSYSDPNTTWTLPYSIPTDGSRGVPQVVTEEGVALVTTHTTPTTVRVSGNYANTTVYIGLRYTAELELSTLFFRRADQTGRIRADTAGRLQVRHLDIDLEKGRYLRVRVTPVERSPYTYEWSVAAPQDGTLRVPILSRNTQVEIKAFNDSPYSTIVNGLEWVGDYHTRARRM